MNVAHAGNGPPYLAPRYSVPGLMRAVLLALLPGIAGMTWLFGWGVAINIVLCVVTALACEAALLALRGRPPAPVLADGSAVLTAVLLGLCLPPLLPWWIPVIGTAFAMIFGKHLYGGLGFNPFNPAMIGYVVLLLSFPREMILWPTPGAAVSWPGVAESLRVVFSGGLGETAIADALTGATPLDHVRTGLETGRELGGLLADAGVPDWRRINLLFLAGGLWLLWRRHIDWRIPAGVLAGLALPAALFWAIDPERFASPLFHLATGGAMLGAFFIATDPVSAATTNRGRLYYGLGIGILTWVIRTWGGYPDGIAFAVLLMNLAAPLIDRYTRPRIHGRPRRRPGVSGGPRERDG